MVLTRRNGLLVEVTDPTYTSGVHHCWISDKRPDSPTIHQILAHGKGDTIGAAVEQATAILAQAMAS